MNRQNLFTSSSKTESIKSVLLKLTVFVCAMIGGFFGCIVPQYTNNYTASLIDKMKRLEETNEPKIVLIGNSNVAFGIRSELIEKAFDMEVVNMGLHGGLGNAFHEEMAKVNINAGDIIVICHSDYNDNGSINNKVLAWTVIENHFDLWKCVPNYEWKGMAMAFPGYVKRCTGYFLAGMKTSSAESAFSRYKFNEYGDYIYSAVHEEYYSFAENYVSAVPSISEECAKRLNELNAFVTDRGGSLVIAGYPIAYGEEKPNSQAFERFREELERKVDCPVISDYCDYFYPYNYFYDTNLHLTNDAAIIRTEQLIKDLKAYKNTIQ